MAPNIWPQNYKILIHLAFFFTEFLTNSTKRPKINNILCEGGGHRQHLDGVHFL